MKKTTQHPHIHPRSIRQPPASGQRPKLVTRRDINAAIQELSDYYHRFEPFFQRHEQSDWSWFYLCGQLSNLERKTIEPMVLWLLGANRNAVRDLQRFMSQGAWVPARSFWNCKAW
ncbi:MAG: transposase [Anaerolineales bacterium]